MKYILLAFLMMFPTMAVADVDPAVEGKRAELFIQKLGDEAIEALKTTTGDDEARRAEFKRILSKNFDMNAIARFALGRYWTVATDAEKKKYEKLFRSMVIDVYTERFRNYSGEAFEVKGSKPAGRKDFVVNSIIQGEKQPIKVDWRVRKGKIIDVIVEGVSMSVTQRSEFASVIQQGGGQVASLITHLEK